MRILATADMHIGRRSSRLPAEWAAELTPAALWLRMIDFAVEENVDAVLVGGDAAEASNSFFEALTPLETGIQHACDAKIPVIMVGGNHDWEVLPRLARMSASGLQILGRDGKWERQIIEGADGTKVQIFGWSFSQRHVPNSPLATFQPKDVDPAIPALGLLHADLDDTGGGKYAPVRRKEFATTGVQTWLLGHTHLPSSLEESRQSPALIYAGSPQGLDPGTGETGIHGPWLIHISADSVRFEQVPLAPIRYETTSILLDHPQNAGEMQEQLLTAVRQALATFSREQPELRCAVLRLRLTGICNLSPKTVRDEAERLAADCSVLDGIALNIDQIDIETCPDLDLEQLAADISPVGTAAALILQLDGKRQWTPDAQRVLDRFLQERASMNRNFNRFLLQEAAETEADAAEKGRHQLRQQAQALLNELVQQKREHK